MGTLTPAIERLQKKLDKDPNSLIFLQLAEEYRKERLYEDALKACQEGLRRHPNYWSARVAMGRIFYEMGDREKAREELEKVIKAVPDNLLANRLLGDIYFESKRYEDSLNRYKLVQMLTPTDSEIAANIQKIESRLLNSLAQPATSPSEPLPSSPSPMISSSLDRVAEKIEPEPVPSEAVEEYRIDKVPDVVNEKPPDVVDFSSLVAVKPDEITDEPEPSLDEIASHFLSVESNATALSEENDVSFSEQSGGLIENIGEPPEEMDAAENQAPKVEDTTQPIKGEDGEGEADELTTQTLAELYVQQGLTDKAVKVYQKLLLNDPNNKQILQRLRELNPAESIFLDNTPTAQTVKEAPPPPTRPRLEESLAASTLDQVAAERRRKITTLENWLTMIRRERS